MKTKKIISRDEAIKNGNSSVNQGIKEKFVDREIHCNVGTLVEACLKIEDGPFSLDDVQNLYTYPEWRPGVKVLGESIYFGGGSEKDKEDFLESTFVRMRDESGELLGADQISEETHENNIATITEYEVDFYAATDDQEPQEVYEWWAVSKWLFDKLSECNQPVLDAGSCYVWGRCTTGQAILLDVVITNICADMGILDGQENSWTKK